MRAFLICLFIFLSSATAALACSPPVDIFKRAYSERLAGAETVFIGKVTDAGADFVEFSVISQGKNSSAAGSTIRMKHAEYGTCGKFDFVKDDIWLYAGDTPFSPSIKISPEGAKASISSIAAAIDAMEKMSAPKEDNVFLHCRQDKECALTPAVCKGDMLSVRADKKEEARGIVDTYRAYMAAGYGCAAPELYAAEKLAPECVNDSCSTVKAP